MIRIIKYTVSLFIAFATTAMLIHRYFAIKENDPMKTSAFKYKDKYYLKMQCDDKYLDMLTDAFDDSPYWIDCLMERLLNPLSKGVTGNRIDISFRENKVLIEPLYVDNPEDYEIEIDRNVLIGLINQWQELVKKCSPCITFIRHDNGTITITDTIECGEIISLEDQKKNYVKMQDEKNKALPNTLIFQCVDGDYKRMPSQDEYLSILSEIFLYVLEDAHEALLNPLSHGMEKGSVVLTIKGNKVTIKIDDFGTAKKDLSIEIDRNALLGLIDQWYKLSENDARKIIFTRHDDGSVTMAGIFRLWHNL